MRPKQIVKGLWASSRSESVAFEALVDFFQTATPKQVLQLEDACRKNDWDGFKDLVMKARVPFETETTLTPSSIDAPPNYLTAKDKK